jgi:hypothetical protein
MQRRTSYVLALSSDTLFAKYEMLGRLKQYNTLHTTLATRFTALISLTIVVQSRALLIRLSWVRPPLVPPK